MKILFTLTLFLLSLYGIAQPRVIQSRWVNSEIIYITTDPITFEQDTIIYKPLRDWFCGGVIISKDRSHLLGLTWYGDLSNYSRPIADHELGIMYGKLLKRNNAVKGLFELEARGSFNYEVISAHLGIHKTILSKTIYHNSQVPRVLLGGKLGYYHFSSIPQLSMSPALSIISPYARFITEISYQFNFGIQQKREMVNGLKFGVKLLLSDHRLVD